MTDDSVTKIEDEIKARQLEKDEKEEMMRAKIAKEKKSEERKAAKIDAAKVAPVDMFRANDAFSEFDPVTGLPLKMKDGSDVSNLLSKRLRKQQRQHSVPYAKYEAKNAYQLELDKYERIHREENP